MKTIIPTSKASGCQRAFTLTDLLVLLATVVLLSVIVFPVFAGVQNKGGRLQCANNLRQIGMGSMIFAANNNGWLPPCTLGAANENGALSNNFDGTFYTYFTFFGGAAYAKVPTNPSSGQGTYQNAGYLYQDGLAGNGSIFFCPSQWANPGYGADGYSPLLSGDSTGNVRSSYFYNPRIVQPQLGNARRAYQTTSQMPPHRLFSMDILLQTGSSTGFNPATIAHARERGWNVLFTDGSVEFARLSETNNANFNTIVTKLVTSGTTQSFSQYNTVFNWLEQDADLGL